MDFPHDQSLTQKFPDKITQTFEPYIFQATHFE